MAIVGSGRFGQRTAEAGFDTPGTAGTSGQVVLRVRSKRAYAFEIHPREAVADLSDVGAVYVYARPVSAKTSARDSSTGLEVGYVGKTDDIGSRDAEHATQGHFTGYGFDIVLIRRIDDASIRADVERDLIDTFNPVLNDLLRGIERGETS